MPKADPVHVALTPEMAAEVQAAVDTGDYGSVSDVVRDALRDWQMRRKVETLPIEDLRRLVQEGMQSGPGQHADDVFARLRAKYGSPLPA